MSDVSPFLNGAIAVGPVLRQGTLAEAMIEALRKDNPQAKVTHRGGYIRVCAPVTLTLVRRSVERALGRRINLPADLEMVMTSFAGCLKISDEGAEWTAN